MKLDEALDRLSESVVMDGSKRADEAFNVVSDVIENVVALAKNHNALERRVLVLEQQMASVQMSLPRGVPGL